MSEVSFHHLIPDVQGSADHRDLPIQKVGIKSLRHPIITGCSMQPYNSISTTNMYVNLPASEKGTHMSRFIEIIDNLPTVNIESLQAVLQQIALRLQADNAFIEMDMPIFLQKTAPISKISSLMDYQVQFDAQKIGEQIEVWQRITVPVTSLCPCSKKISDYGAHNQRSHIVVSTLQTEHCDFAPLIQAVEEQASSELFGVLKRPDEKYVTERAYDNPKFVEDLVRDVALAVCDFPHVLACQISSENFESIHNHSAYAVIAIDKR